MADEDENFNPLYGLFGAISNIELYCDDLYYEDDENYEIASRGPMRSDIQRRIILNQRKKIFIQKIDALKEIIQQKDETKGIKILASLINEILDSRQRIIFMAELNGHEIQNTEYIPIQTPNLCGSSDINGYELVSRSGEPYNSYVQEDPLDSLMANGEEDHVRLPIEVKYNPSEVYLIHKGIYFCRVLLNKFNESNDKKMLDELKTKGVLNIVMTEEIPNEKNYIMMLVNGYPKSLEEIKFIFKEEQELLLKSSIFVNLAQRNVQYLYECLVQLTTIIEKNVLSRACDQAQDKGVMLISILSQNYSAEVKVYADKITKFINRHKQGNVF